VEIGYRILESVETEVEAVIVAEKDKPETGLAERGGAPRRHSESEALPRVREASHGDRRLEIRHCDIGPPQ